MRSSSAEMIAARAKANLVSRDFIRIAGRNFSTGAIEWANFWSDLGAVTAPVLDLDTGTETNYDFIGSGSLISVDPITYVCEQTITVRTLTVTLSQIDQNVANQIRGYDLHEQPCNIYQGDFDLTTRSLVSAAESVWSGFVDTVEIIDPSAESMGSIALSIRSHQTEMTRINTAKRSHASELTRNSGDAFFNDVATVGSWVSFWGQDRPKTLSQTTATDASQKVLRAILR